MSALLLISGIAMAQEEQNDGPIIALEYQGQAGVWMPTETFRVIVQIIEEADLYKQGYSEMAKEAERLDKLHESEFERRLQAEANAETQKAYRNYALIGGGVLSVGTLILGLFLGR
jgi:hypothetical protein